MSFQRSTDSSILAVFTEAMCEAISAEIGLISIPYSVEFG